MDTSARRTCGRVTGSEEMNPTTMPQGGYVPRGGFMQRGRGGGRQRDLCEVGCYMLHGMKMAALLQSWLVMVRIVSYP